MNSGRGKTGRFVKGSKVNQGRVPSVAQREKQSKSMSGRVLLDSHKEAIRAGLLKAAAAGKPTGRPKGGTPWNKGMSRANGDPVPGYAPLSRAGREKLSRMMAKRMSEAWKDPAYAKKCLSCNSPNKAEVKLLKILEALYPGEWKFVGDGQIIIDRKCPDFININGKKKIIELYGERWHEGEDPKDRAAIFAPYGYKTLIVWQKEMRNIDNLKTKLNVFMEAV